MKHKTLLLAVRLCGSVLWRTALTLNLGLETLNCSAQGTRVFFDGFESGNINLWENGGAGISTIQPYSGTYVAQSNWDGTVVWNDPNSLRGLSLLSWPYSTEFLVRFKMRVDQDVDANLDGGSGGKLFRLPFAGDKDGNEIVLSRTQTHVYASANNTPLLSIWGCSDALEDRGWHQIEIYVKDASNGSIRIWMDDSEFMCANSSGISLPYYGNTRQNISGWDNFYLAVQLEWGTRVLRS